MQPKFSLAAVTETEGPWPTQDRRSSYGEKNFIYQTFLAKKVLKLHFCDVPLEERQWDTATETVITDLLKVNINSDEEKKQYTHEIIHFNHFNVSSG